MAILRGYIGLGSNLGDRLSNLQRAVDMMAATARLRVLSASSVYESPPWGYQSEHDYFNAVVTVDWDGPPLRLLEHCYRIEAALGRHREGPHAYDGYHDRTVDLDIIWLDGMESKAERLVLPHPSAHQRGFVLLPLVEIAPWLDLQGRPAEAWIAELDAAEREATRVVPDAVLKVGDPPVNGHREPD